MLRSVSPQPADMLTSADAVRRFLDHMTARIDQPFDDFIQRLKSALDDSALPLEERFAFFDRKDLSAIFLTHVVAMEAALVRTVFDVSTADALLADVAEQLDGLEFADRTRATVPLSDMFWDVLARVQICTIDETKKPHDIALKHMLGALDLRRKETADVLKDFVVRHSLGECLARCTQFWWINLSQSAEISLDGADPSGKSGVARATDFGLPGLTRLDG